MKGISKNAQNTNPIICLGMPVYNGEDFLKQRLESIINQSYSNFILIISDNASTDNSQKICEEISKKDKRITYFRQEENKGGYWNFNFVLKKAKTKYFVWVPPDDIWSQNFLEKNIDVLEKNENIVGSIGELSLYNQIKDPLTHKIRIKVLKNTKKFQYVHPAYGVIEEKIKFYLNYSMGAMIFGVYRTDKLQKAAPHFEHIKNGSMWMGDLAYILNIIKEGDFEVVNDAFMYKHVRERSTSVIEYMKKENFNLKIIVFIHFPFTFWCLRNLGLKIFLKNFGYFIKLNIKGEYSIMAESVRMCKRVLCGQSKYW